jgi:hypothetical protein
MPRPGPNKEIKKLIDIALAQGWTVTYTGGCHLRWCPPSGKQTVYSATTPTDRRALKNMKARLRRSGLLLEKNQ